METAYSLRSGPQEVPGIPFLYVIHAVEFISPLFALHTSVNLSLT